MARITVRRARPGTGSHTGLAVALGLGLGATIGFLAGALAGPGASRVLRRRSRPLPPGTSMRALVEQAQAVLDDDLVLRDCALEVVPVGSGRIELHGWVADRSSRARAARLVGDAVRADAIINCLLVHGEDDPSPDTDEPDADELLA